MQTADKFTLGSNFEQSLVQALLLDKSFAEQMSEVLDVNYFTINFLKFTAAKIFEFHQQYKTVPSLELLRGIIKESSLSDVVKTMADRYFDKIYRTPLNGDLEFVKDSSLEFCRKRKLLIALEKCLGLTEERNFDQIVHEIQSAVAAGAERDHGHIYEDRLEERMMDDNRKPVPTPWKVLNGMIGGGVSSGELAVILALTGVGKSHFLVDVGAAAALAGLCVVHLTFELSEIKVGKRYDARISGVPFDLLKDHREYVETCLAKLPGKIRIKKYPNRKATVQTIRAYINKLKLDGVEPDLIIVDYADIMKSSKHYENKRFEEEAVYEELRSFSDEISVPIWTASQTNRSGMDASVLTLKHIAECFAKANISDLFITMNRRKTGEDKTIGNFYIAKSRLGTDGIKFNVIVDTATSKIECLEPHSNAEKEAMLKYDAVPESDQERIRKKLEQMNSGSTPHFTKQQSNQQENAYHG